VKESFKGWELLSLVSSRLQVVNVPCLFFRTEIYSN
jgi:hypothetical protein